jgi:hypothetical protein
MKNSFLIILNLAALLAAGCSSTPTKVNTGPIPAATYSFIAGGAQPDFADSREQMHAVIQESISRNLAGKGLNKMAAGGDEAVAIMPALRPSALILAMAAAPPRCTIRRKMPTAAARIPITSRPARC